METTQRRRLEVLEVLVLEALELAQTAEDPYVAGKAREEFERLRDEARTLRREEAGDARRG